MHSPHEPSRSETYTNGYDETVLAFMRRRTLAEHGKMLEPLICPGQTMLDLACGPGNMTLELAQRLGSNGKVFGADINGDQFPADSILPFSASVKFLKTDAYRLDFSDNQFDGVFCHALFEHLARPFDALREIQRVLKPGGYVALRSPDWGGVVADPNSDALEEALAARLELQRKNGGDVYAGRKLGRWLKESNFAHVHVAASYEIYPETKLIAEHLAFQMAQRGQPHHEATWRDWGSKPDAIFAQAWFEATGRKVIQR